MRSALSDTASPASGVQLLIEQERTGLPLLQRRRRDGLLQVYLLEPSDDQLTVGRSSECDIVIEDDPSVSRTHLELVRLGDGWLAEDQGLSRNGTLLDSEPLAGRRRLHDAAQLTVGATVLEYRSPVRPQDAGHTVTITIAAGQGPPSITAAQLAVLVEFVRPILGGAAAPASNAEIASTLVISQETVKSHLKDLYVRFGLADVPPAVKRAELAQRAISLGAVGRADLTG